MSDKENTDQKRDNIAFAKALFEREPTPFERTIAKAFSSTTTTEKETDSNE